MKGSLKMKRIIVTSWLLICLTPLWAMAGEPFETPASEGFILASLGERFEASLELSLPEWKEGGIRLSDGELSLITGQALVTDSPISVTTDSRIILWDEVDTKAASAINQGGGQSITTISR